MIHTITDKIKALSIVSVFETGKAMGDPTAVAVLDDGAGVSYGMSQFTHRSGSLGKVVDAYLATGCEVGREVLEARVAQLARTTSASIGKLSEDYAFKKALRAAGVTREMKQVQLDTAIDLYLRPAFEFCERRGLGSALSLAVVYDSMVHGSFDRFASRVDTRLNERDWVTEYVRARHAWLMRVERLKVTAYRTRFFLAEIRRGNWSLELPLVVHGVRITRLPEFEVEEPEPVAAATDILKTAHDTLATAAEKFDRVDSAVTTVTSRRDAAKSLWTTIGGAISQVVWAVFGWMAGIPREVWIVVAVIVAALLLLYLWRQIEMGRIRERSEPPA